MRRLLPVLRPLAAILSGTGMALLFPPHSISKLVWLVMVPLLLALWSLGEEKRKRKAFGLGYLTGLGFFLLNLVWLRTVSDAGWIALSLYLSLFPAAWAVFASTLGNPWRKEAGEEGLFHAPLHAFVCGATWAGLEWLRGWLFTGFGWNPLGVAFHETPVFSQAADLLGATSLSILPIFVQAVLIQICVRRVSQYHSAERRRRVALACTTVLMISCYGYGIWRIRTANQAESIRLKALLVQLNIPQEAGKVEWEALDIHLGYEEDTIAALKKSRPDWVIWPETSLTGRILRMDDGTWAMPSDNLISIDRVREAGNFTLILGLNELEGEMHGEEYWVKENTRAWNTMTVMPPDGSLETFRKHHLVIFGEYIPFVDKLPFLAKIYEQQTGTRFGGGFSVGESLEPMKAQVRGQEVQIIPTVCFEDSVGRLVRKFTRDAPQVIVNITNDGWFKESEGAAQHFANARFRAIELRRPLVRASNTGVSAAVSTTGITLHPQTKKPQELRDANGSTFTRGSLIVDIDIPKHPSRTLYSMIGDWGLIGLSIASLLLMWWRCRRNTLPPEEAEA
ncbi:apolipoprotein N-acyltransferase [Luteolibacter sp. GHJ8]|uniref:Apolipoprotein N-acyltransferase n=1 Tax=Luteolibacter rhizosphaerae TaxID=2989719 RepID=A0ABT3G3J3_9BACT|nr:apolipoprotein N-acyltransferase [Luteolibacter rhizosphaerae]MCW1914237.1 apolipoprotein N-acyltransferase [Luteolibacter rhizosphaerae]